MVDSSLTIAPSGRRAVPLRIIAADDVYLSLTGAEHPVFGYNTLAAIESVRFAPFTMSRDEINAPDARQILLEKVRDARAHAEDLVNFTNGRFHDLPGSYEYANAETLHQALDKIEQDPGAAIERFRRICKEYSMSQTPREELRQLEHTMRSSEKAVPTVFLEAFNRERIPFVVWHSDKKDEPPLSEFATREAGGLILTDGLMNKVSREKGVVELTGRHVNNEKVIAKDCMEVIADFYKDVPTIASVNKSYTKTYFNIFTKKATAEEVETKLRTALIYEHLHRLGVQEVNSPSHSRLYYNQFMDNLAALNEVGHKKSAVDLTKKHGIHLLDKNEVRPPAPGVLPADSIELHTGLMLTPACISHANKTGEYHYLTLNENQEAKDTHPDAAYSLAHLLVSFDKAALKDKESFLKVVHTAQQKLHGNGVMYRLENGDAVATDNYFATIERDADKWVAQAHKQQNEINEAPDHQEILTEFKRQYAQMDEAARTLIQREGVKFIMNPATPLGTLVTNQEQRFVMFNPFMLKDPLAIHLMREQALAHAFDESKYPGLEHLWETANSEMRLHESQIPGEWRRKANGLMLIVAALAKQEPERGRQILPLTTLANHIYEYRVKKEAEAVLHGALQEIRPTTAFVVDAEALTQPQQAYFRELNHVVKTLHVTPAEFDAQFRFCVRQLQAINLIAQKAAVEKLHDIKTTLRSGEVLGTPKQLPTIVSRPQPPNYIKPNATTTLEQQTLSLSAQECMLGFNDAALPILPMQHEKDIAATHEGHIDGLAPPTKNMLQAYASGELPLALLKNMRPYEAEGNKRLHSIPRPDQFFTAAIQNSIDYLSQKKDITGEALTSLQTSMQKLEALKTEMLMWPDELAKAEKQKQDAAASKAAQSKSYGTQKTGEESTAYTIDTQQQGAYARILKGSDKGTRRHWMGIKNTEAQEEDKQLSLRMHYLHHEEIEPLHSLINVKLPGHQELADVLFADTTLQRAEFACKLPNADKLRAHPEGFKTRAQTAIAHFFAQDLTQIPEGERWRYEHIKDYLLKSPTLLIAALGNDPDVRKLRETHKELLGTSPEATTDWRAREAALAAQGQSGVMGV